MDVDSRMIRSRTSDSDAAAQGGGFGSETSSASPVGARDAHGYGLLEGCYSNRGLRPQRPRRRRRWWTGYTGGETR
ncbi:hypothetical protein GUJ93_ZPchr0012g19188 [Zizania palustris]|uniref:Uncharacterized protein n=1 Tax=Zizania palustris TaxID=103762 RepID=A0A8J6BWF4_ZIZPA|nr:hypothetical protein GUJ93_ZPchr0012g19188 [Zizania palustris]